MRKKKNQLTLIREKSDFSQKEYSKILLVMDRSFQCSLKLSVKITTEALSVNPSPRLTCRIYTASRLRDSEFKMSTLQNSPVIWLKVPFCNSLDFSVKTPQLKADKVRFFFFNEGYLFQQPLNKKMPLNIILFFFYVQFMESVGILHSLTPRKISEVAKIKTYIFSNRLWWLGIISYLGEYIIKMC